GPRPLSAPDLEPASGELGALPHRGQADMAGTRERRIVGHEATAVVDDVDADPTLAGLEHDLDLRCAGVLPDVGEGLLDDAVRGRRDVDRGLLGQPVNDRVLELPRVE